MITDEIHTHAFLKEASTACPIPLEKQARDLSEKVFFDVQTLLQRSHHEAEENLHAFQALANSEIAHMESMLTTLEEKNNVLSSENNALQSTLMHLKSEKMGLQSQIERQHADMLVLHENISRIQAHHRHMQATHEAETLLLKDTLQRLKEKEDNLHYIIQNEKNEKMKLLQDNISLQRQLEDLRSQSQETLEQKEWEYQQKIETEKQEKTKLDEKILTLEQSKIKWMDENLVLQREKQALIDEAQALKAHLETHQKTIEQIRVSEHQQRDAYASMEAHYKNKLTTLQKTHIDEKNAIVSQLAKRSADQTSVLEVRIQKLESLIALERENAKNKQINLHKQWEEAQANHSLAQKEKQAALSALRAIHAEQEKNMGAIGKVKALEKEISVIAQKKLTVEINMKQLHQELVECKRIISALRKSNI